MTDLPDNAIDCGVRTAGSDTGVAMRVGTDDWEMVDLEPGRDYQVLVIPVSEPEPTSLAERMAEISVMAIHERAPRPSVTWDEMTEPGKDLVTASMQAVINELGLVSRDEVPSISQVMEALGFRDEGGVWVCEEADYPWPRDRILAHDRLTAIGIRPDDEI